MLTFNISQSCICTIQYFTVKPALDFYDEPSDMDRGEEKYKQQSCACNYMYLKPAQAKPPNPTATVRLATTALGVVECATASRNSV